MRTTIWGSLVTLVLFATGMVHAQELTATLNLRIPTGQTVGFVDVDETFKVVLQNDTPVAISIPNPESAIGYESFRFAIGDPEANTKLNITRNIYLGDDEKPPIELQPEGSYSFYVSLGEFHNGERSWQNLPVPDSGRQMTIRIELDCEGVTAKSADYPFQFVFARAELPQHYLFNGFPDKALEMLKADPQLVQRIDEDKRTSLHVAARFGHTAIAEWLLAQKADTNAVAYNQFTPLHLTSDPEIVQMLLQAGANPNLADTFGVSPLQKAIKLAHPTNVDAAVVKKWQGILDVYLAEGVEFELLPAIEIGDLQRVKTLLADTPGLLDQYVTDQQPLRAAVRSGELDIVNYLLTAFPKKMDVDNFAGGTGYPVAKLALRNSTPDVLELLITQGADLDRRITWQGPRTGRWIIGDNATLLHFAARDGNTQIVRSLLDQGIDPFAFARSDTENIGLDRQTALHVATLFSKLQNATAILDHKSFQTADRDQQQSVLDECLKIAVNHYGTPSPELCSLLIDAGANPNVEADQPTLIQQICKSVHPSNDDTQVIADVADILLASGVELDLYSAIALQREESVVGMLNDNPELATTQGPNGFPALHMATKLGNAEIVRSLLAAGCDANIENQSKDSGDLAERALHQAAFWNRMEIAKQLIASGADVNAVTAEQVTAIHHAARMGNVEMVKLLLKNGADPTLGDRRGMTPAHWAGKHTEIKRLLQPKKSGS